MPKWASQCRTGGIAFPTEATPNGISVKAVRGLYARNEGMTPNKIHNQHYKNYKNNRNNLSKIIEINKHKWG
jgi:hypothetical protein